MAYEASTQYDGNHIEINHYASIHDMKNNFKKDELVIDRTLGHINEGTPSFEEVEFNGNLSNSKLTMRFHYYFNNDVDH